MEDFVTYEQALKLKELGFDWVCYYYDKDNQKFNPNVNDLYATLSTDDLLFNNNRLWKCISAPTLSQAQKWLREVKGIILVANIKFHKGRVKFSWYIVTDNGERGICEPLEKSIFDTYEQALSAGIDKVLEIIE